MVKIHRILNGYNAYEDVRSTQQIKMIEPRTKDQGL